MNCPYLKTRVLAIVYFLSLKVCSKRLSAHYKPINSKFLIVGKLLLNAGDAAGGQNRLLVLLETTFE